VSPDDPRHGTYAGTLAHNRGGTPKCLPCVLAGRRYVKAAKMRLDKGVRNRIPLGQRAYDILTNVGPTPVAEATGLWRNNLYRAQRGGPGQVVLRSTRDAILRVQAPTAIGTQRRVRALAAHGHTLAAIGAASGVHPEWLARMSRADTPPRVTQRLAEGIAAAYDQLRDTDPPEDRQTTRRRSTSARRGWLPPQVWDDIDDPAEDPLAVDDPDYLDPVLIDRIIDGDYNLLAHVPATDDARTELCRRWWESGRSLNDLEKRGAFRVLSYFRVRDQAVSA
jgi:hypothetical protein